MDGAVAEGGDVDGAPELGGEMLEEGAVECGKVEEGMGVKERGRGWGRKSEAGEYRSLCLLV